MGARPTATSRALFRPLGPTDTANEVNEVSLRKLLGAVLMVKPGVKPHHAWIRSVLPKNQHFMGTYGIWILYIYTVIYIYIYNII